MPPRQILLYDHLLTFGDEVRLIWSAKSSTTKFLFLAMRYVVPSMMILHTVALSGLSDIHLSDEVCKAWVATGIFAGAVTQGINNWLVLLRLWVLWERQRTLILCTLLLFMATESATMIGGWIGIAHMLPHMFFEPTLHLCAFRGQYSIYFLRVPGLIFQFVVLVALAWRALRHGQASLSSMYPLGLLNTILFFVPPNFLAFPALFFIWCFTTTMTCRMILNLRRTPNGESPYRLSWSRRA
ncbi:hypothetical protein C8J57DRAFT_356695 [Mycena rebaudengoi]|nr:hypothetical protein C8J57DRAFT_356695 [Mycena rebaudengoi]